MEPVEAVGAAPAELVPIPALRWLAGALRPRMAVRLGLGGGAALAALARAAEGIGAPAPCVGVPCGEGEPGAAARAVARDRGEVVRLADRGERPPEGVDLLSVAAGEAAALDAWRGALAPGAAVAIDAPDAAAAEVAAAALAHAFGPEAPVVVLGGLAVALPGGAPPAERAWALGSGPRGAALSALLGRLGRAMAAEAARTGGGGGAPAEALRRAEDLADARLAGLVEARGRALAAVRRAEALREEADAMRRSQAARDGALAHAAAVRERALETARSRVAALEAEVARLRGELAQRFEEIALLTRERLGLEGEGAGGP